MVDLAVKAFGEQPLQAESLDHDLCSNGFLDRIGNGALRLPQLIRRLSCVRHEMAVGRQNQRQREQGQQGQAPVQPQHDRDVDQQADGDHTSNKGGLGEPCLDDRKIPCEACENVAWRLAYIEIDGQRLQLVEELAADISHQQAGCARDEFFSADTGDGCQHKADRQPGKDQPKRGLAGVPLYDVDDGLEAVRKVRQEKLLHEQGQQNDPAHSPVRTPGQCGPA